MVPVADLVWNQNKSALQIRGFIVSRVCSVITENDVITNTTEEQTIYTAALDEDEFRTGNYLVVKAVGVISNASADDDLTVRVYIGDTKLEEFHPAIGNVSGADWHIDVNLTVRDGAYAVHIDTIIAGYEDLINSIQNVGSAVPGDIHITVQWDNASVDNEITIYQGVLEYKH